MVLRSDLAVVWVGVDESEWFIHGHLAGRRRGEQGVILQKATGLLGPPSKLRRRAGARQDGSTAGTRKVDERIVDLDLIIRPARGRSLDDVAEAWERSWDFEKPGRLKLITRRGVRWLGLHLDREQKPDLEVDPHRRNVLLSSLTAVAPDPFAHSEPWVRDITVPAGGEATVLVENPATAPTFPRFYCPPGLWQFPDGVTGDSVPLGRADASFRVDTNPAGETVRVDGREDGWRLLLGRGFRTPIPPRTPPTPVTIVGPPGATFRMLIEQRWWSSW